MTLDIQQFTEKFTAKFMWPIIASSLKNIMILLMVLNQANTK